MRKRLLALAMGLVMTASVLAGCGAKEAGETAPAANAENSAAEQGAAESSVSEGTQAGGTVSDQDLVDLRLIFYGDMSSRREEFFKNEFHDAVLEDLNIDLTVEFFAMGFRYKCIHHAGKRRKICSRVHRI